MAKIKSVRVGRTKNIGNYESARADIEIDIEPGDTLAGVLTAANLLVGMELGDYTTADTHARLRELVESKQISGRGLEGVAL